MHRPRFLVLTIGAFALLLAVGCGPGASGQRDGGGGGDAATPCTDGSMQCNGRDLLVCTGGVFQTSTTCAEACDDTLGCVGCVAGSARCDGDVSTYCPADG